MQSDKKKLDLYLPGHDLDQKLSKRIKANRSGWN